MKLPLTLQEQIKLLKSRSLSFDDESKVEDVLSRLNYYRLSGYWRKYQIDPENGNDNFRAGTTFEEIVELYNLDSELRNLLRKGIEIFEVFFRTKFAYCMAHSEENGQFLYLRSSSYSYNPNLKFETPQELLEKIENERKRSTEIYAKHYKNKGEEMPIWAAVELLSFGTISKMYSRYLNKSVVKNVSLNFKSIKSYEETIGILHAFVYLRNLCAHQARIWNRKTSISTTDKNYLQKFGYSKYKAQWRIISILMLLVDEINQNNEYSKEVLDLCRSNDEFYAGLTDPNL